LATETRATTEVDPTFAPLHDQVREAMERLKVPGVSVGIIVDGVEHVAPFGVTNVDYPSPVIEDTLFQIGSTTKTVTGTVIMRLVEAGSVDLDATVRTYLPGLTLIEPSVAENVTVRHLLNHTAGWTGDYFTDTGRGDDALSRVVEGMAGIQQLTPLGEIWSYNNAAFYLAGRVIEVVTGKTYEAAARELVLDPLGMTNSFFFPEEVMLRSFVVGHNEVEGALKVATPWPIGRNANPAGGLASSAGDQLRYARFHMGDGAAEDGTRVLSPESLRLMQTPTLSAGDMGEMGLSWFIRDVGGVRLVAHGGSTNGQQSSFEFAPDRNFALTVLTNAGAGSTLGEEIGKWALEHYLGVREPEPEHQERSEAELAPFVGTYMGVMTAIDLAEQEGGLRISLSFHDTPFDVTPEPPPPTRAKFYAEDKVIALDGMFKGARGEFLRDAGGDIAWFRFGGRIQRKERAPIA
jgi:CubicO group peptidase (beta-lactamase class C family)